MAGHAHKWFKMVGLILANGYQNAKFEIYQNLPPPKLPAIQYLNTLGQSIPDNVSSHTVLLSPVDDISSTPVSNIHIFRAKIYNDIHWDTVNGKFFTPPLWRYCYTVFNGARYTFCRFLRRASKYSLKSEKLQPLSFFS